MQIGKWIFKALAPFTQVPYEESGDRHTFWATSAKYPARDIDGISQGVALPEGVEVAVGTDGVVGSGVYTINLDGESGGPEVVEVLARLRKEKVDELVWTHTLEEYNRITADSEA